MNLFEPLILPNGATITNRIAKAAMEENMADKDHAPSEGLMRLYQAWADGTAHHRQRHGGSAGDDRLGEVVLEDDAYLDRFKHWAEVGRSKGSQFWLQINHPGRQMQANLGQTSGGGVGRS